MKKKIKKFFKFSAVSFFIAVFGFSNFISLLPQILQNNKLAESLKIKEAQAVGSNFKDGVSVAVPTAIAAIDSIATTLAAGDNLVIATVQFDNTAITGTSIAAGNFELRRGTLTTDPLLSENQFIINIPLESTSNTDGGFRILIGRDAAAPANATYGVFAAAAATGVNAEVKFVVIEQTGANHTFQDGAAVALTTTASTVVLTHASTVPAGDNVIMAVLQVDRTGAGAVSEILTAASIARTVGTGTLTGGAMQNILTIPANNLGSDGKYAVLLARDAGVSANPTYTVNTTALTANELTVEAKIFVLNGLSSAILDSAAVTMPTALTAIGGSLATTFADGDAILLSAFQADNQGSDTTVAAGNNAVGLVGNAATRVSNQFIVNAPRNTRTDRDPFTFYVNKIAVTAANPSYEGLIAASAAAGTIEHKMIAIRIPPSAATTTLGNGTDPGNSTVAPGSAITDLDSFTLATNTGTDSVTALTVTLTGVNSFESLSEIRITSDNGATLYFAAVANPASNTVSFSAGTPIPVSTTSTQFKVRITPKTHPNMPVPPGLSYAVGGTVTGFTSTNPQAGTDTASATITVDNLSPGNVTATSGTAGNTQVTLNYTTPADTDLNSVVILRNTVAITATPTEGATYIVGDPVGADAVGCVDSTVAASTADSCIATGLTNGTAYHFKIFVKDTNGNYSATGVVPTGSPFTPVANTTTLGDGINPGNATLAPGDPRIQVDRFTFVTSAGTDSVTAVTVTLATGTSGGLSLVQITDDGGTTLGSVTNPASDTPSITLDTPISVSTTSTQFRIYITPKTHANMPAPPGASYAVTARITSWTGSNTQAGTDDTSATITIDNLSPNGATSVSGTAGDAANTINWTTSNSADFNTTSGSVILRWAAATAGSEVPAEGSTATIGAANGTAIVACVVSSAASTALSRIDGTGGSVDCTTTALTNGQAYTYKAFQKDTSGNYDVGVTIGTFTPSAPAVTLTIGVTAGSKVTNLNSGDTLQYANTTSCASAAACSAFTLSISSGSETITSIKITETGTADATNNLANLALFYDTDGNYSNGVTGQYGTTVAAFTAEAGTVSGSLAISSGTTYYFYVRFDLAKAGAYPVGGQTVNFQIAADADVGTTGSPTKTGAPVSLAGTTTVRPNVTSITSYPDAAQLGGKVGQTLSLAGAGFGTTCNGTTSKVEIGTYALSCTGATFTNTTISIPLDSGITVYGGTSANGLLVTIGGTADDARQTFFVLPSINNIVTTSGVSNAERIGQNVTLSNSTANAAKFGTAAGTVNFTGGFGSVSATIVSWGDTSLSVTVPAGIGSSVYLGDITITRNADSKTATATGFRILPRITANNPASGVVNDKIQITGDHLCQSGTCPVSPNRSSAANNVKFGSTQAADTANGDDFFNSGGTPCSALTQAWNHTEICIAVPAGVPTGSQPIQVTSDTSYTSNTQAFTVNSSVPNNPNVAGTRQYKSDNTTVISAGGTTNESTVILKADISASITINMALQVEVKPTGTAFACGAGDCAAAVEGTVVGGGACTGCTALANAKVTVTGLSDGQKHWQARVRNTTSNEYSDWVSFGTDPDSVWEIDFITDTIAPTIAFTPTDTCLGGQSNIGTNSATINWNINELADGQVEYGTDSNLVGSTNYPASPAPAALTHAITLSNLNSGIVYYYKVKSRDNAGNITSRPSSSPYCQFSTTSVTQGPAKTVTFHIAGATGAISGLTSYPFTVALPENSTSTQSAFVEITGISVAVASPTIGVSVNSQSTKNYAVPASTTTHFKILYRVTPVLISNTLNITPANTTISITSAKIIVTYAYTP